jgi:hypothetical protein
MVLLSAPRPNDSDLLCHKLCGHFMSYHMTSAEHFDVASKHNTSLLSQFF